MRVGKNFEKKCFWRTCDIIISFLVLVELISSSWSPIEFLNSWEDFLFPKTVFEVCDITTSDISKIELVTVSSDIKKVILDTSSELEEFTNSIEQFVVRRRFPLSLSVETAWESKIIEIYCSNGEKNIIFFSEDNKTISINKKIYYLMSE